MDFGGIGYGGGVHGSGVSVPPSLDLGGAYEGQIGDTNFVVRHINRATWVTPDYYDNLTSLGVGAYGTVCSAEDTRTGLNVAIKKLQRPFEVDAKHALRVYREIKLLRFFEHENAIGLLDLFHAVAPGADTQEVYIVTELMGSDLHRVIQSQVLGEDLVQFIGYQILRALVYVHSANIIHRDIKPSNIAINSDCDVKLLDFGLSRTDADGGMTGYVATRWYRAPEIMLNWGSYTKAMDMWSVGCILAELMTGRPLFPGQDHMDHLNKICLLLGKPGPAIISSIDSAWAAEYVISLPEMPAQDFAVMFPRLPAPLVDLLKHLLTWDPAARYTAQEAIRHPFFEAYHDPDDEPVVEVPFDDSFESTDLTIAQLRLMVMEEVAEAQIVQARLQAELQLQARQQEAILMQEQAAQQAAQLPMMAIGAQLPDI